MLRLRVTYGSDEQVFAIPVSEARLGSASNNDIVLRVRGVSRRHALVRRCPGGLEFSDLGSKNGILVGGRRVERAILTPGMRIQIGAALIDLEEISSSEGDLASRESPGMPTTLSETSYVGSQVEGLGSSSPGAALRLAHHIDLVGMAKPDLRSGLFARARTTLGAETLTFVERIKKGYMIRDHDGIFIEGNNVEVLELVTGEPWTWPEAEVRLRSRGAFLLAGFGKRLLVAKFAEERLPQEGWRRDFLRFLAEKFLNPGQPIDDLYIAEVRRVLELTGGNISETAQLLGVQRQTIYNILKKVAN